jgi:hypothetical protein
MHKLSYSEGRSLQKIIRANKAWAKKNDRVCWFDKGAMQFFSSRVEYVTDDERYFISSEQYLATEYAKEYLGGTDGERRYTIRIVDSSGQIHTRGDFQAYASVQEACKALAEVW